MIGGQGGDVKFKRFIKDVKNYLGQPKVYVTTMFDFTRIDRQWPGKDKLLEKKKRGSVSSNEKADVLEKETKAAIVANYPKQNPEQRFIPYIQMHEFEALVYSDKAILVEALRCKLADIDRILKDFPSPEDINDDPNLSPAKRIIRLVPHYQKIVTGVAVSKRIGLAGIREKCPHFNGWITRLENLEPLR